MLRQLYKIPVAMRVDRRLRHQPDARAGGGAQPVELITSAGVAPLFLDTDVTVEAQVRRMVVAPELSPTRLG